MDASSTPDVAGQPPTDKQGNLEEQLQISSHEIVAKVWDYPIVSWHFVAQSVPHLFEIDPEKRRVFERLAAGYRDTLPYVRDPVRILQFMELMDIANQAPEGDYLELGTYRGMSARLIYRLMDPSRTLYCLDTFEGFTEADLAAERQIDPDHTWQPGFLGDTSLEAVAARVGDGERPSNLKLVKGRFPESFQGLEDLSWRFIHLDMDLYEPTRIALEMLWPRLVPGGVMVFHDYVNLKFRGIRRAVDAYFDRLGLRVLPMGDRWYSAMIVKPRPVPAP